MATLTTRPPLTRVVADVARAFGLEARLLTGRSRAEHIVEARHAAMLILRHAYGLSLATTGALLGGRDHTTIRHGVQAAATRCRHDAAFAARVAALSPQESDMADDALTTAARACVEAPLRVAEQARQRRADEALDARLHTHE